MNILKYKNYFTKIEYSAEDQVLYGKIEGIKDLVNFESEDLNGIEQAFHDAVDDYLVFCKELGQEPDKVYSGTFNVRINPELHRGIANMAIERDVSLNSIVEEAIEKYVYDASRNNYTIENVKVSEHLFCNNILQSISVNNNAWR